MAGQLDIMADIKNIKVAVRRVGKKIQRAEKEKICKVITLVG